MKTTGKASSVDCIAKLFEENATTVFLVVTAAIVLFCSAPGIDYRWYATDANEILDGAFLTFQGDVTSIGYRKHSWGVSAQLAPVVCVSRGFGYAVPACFAATLLLLAQVPLLWRAFLNCLDNRDQCTVAVLCLFLGSQLPFFVTHVGADSFILPALAGLWLYAVGYRSRRFWFDVTVVAILTAAIGINRSYLMIYALPAMVRLFIDCGNWTRRLGSAAGFSLAVLVAAGTAAYQNYAVTGNWWRSPYSFGDSQWQSLRLGESPFFWDVLLSPYHGLVPYNPLCALGMVVSSLVLPVLCWRKQLYVEAVMWSSATVAYIVTLWFVGSFYYWDMAARYGSRGLLAASVPAALAIARLWSLSPATRRLLTGLIFAGVLWAYLLSTRGIEHYATYGEVAVAAFTALPELLVSSRLLVMALLLPVCCLLWWRSDQRAFLIPLSCMMLTLVIPGAEPPSLYLLIGVVLTPVFVIGLLGLSRRWHVGVTDVVLAAQVIYGVFVACLLLRVGLNTEVVVYNSEKVQYSLEVLNGAGYFEKIPQYRQHAEEIRQFVERQQGKQDDG